MLTPEKFIGGSYLDCDKALLTLLQIYHKSLIQSIIDDLEANRNKNAVEYLKSKL